MKVLVLSKDVWSNEKPFGNTLSNWFGGEEWKEDRFQNIYVRDEIPNNQICEKHFKITMMDIVKHVFRPGQIGQVMYSNDRMGRKIEASSSAISSERRVINRLKKIRSRLVYEMANGIVETLYYTKSWQNKKFETFIEDFSPDIVFSYFADDGFVKPVIEYVKKHTQVKVVLMAADDVYGFSRKSIFLRRNRQLRNLQWLADNADYFYGASEEICNYYSCVYNRQFIPLYKGCDICFEVTKKENTPKRIIYAGNLLYGRKEVLCQISRALARINENGTKAILEIYTKSPVAEDELKNPSSTILKGPRTYSEIVEIMKESDIVLHVESFDLEQIETVKYSFSTKIIDCLQSGAVAVAIGPKDVASVEYFKRIDGAYVINDLNEIENTFRYLLQNADLYDCASRINRFAVKHHSINCVRQSLRADFEKILSE